MLEKKDVVQKSFRIHRQNDIWLGFLAAKLGRTQNELVNIAIKMLLDDNKKWFFENFLEVILRESTQKREKEECIVIRLGDTEVKIIPFNMNPKHVTSVYVTYYENDTSDKVVGSEEFEEQEPREVVVGPGYDQRLLHYLVEVFEPALEKYPSIMKDFNPGAVIEE